MLNTIESTKSNEKFMKRTMKAQLAELWAYLSFTTGMDVLNIFNEPKHTFKTKIDENIHKNCMRCGAKAVRNSFCSGSCSKEFNELKRFENKEIQNDLMYRKSDVFDFKKLNNMYKYGVL